ncbi:hypothetical protein LT493_37805 [Streptomyces tricolor]|nr:hypothetical protein [Streptomyces tricolor]
MSGSRRLQRTDGHRRTPATAGRDRRPGRRAPRLYDVHARLRGHRPHDGRPPHRRPARPPALPLPALRAGPLRDDRAARHLAGLLDDRLLDLDTADGLDGYVWGVGCHSVWETGLLPESAEARRWAQVLGTDVHEVRIETDAHDLTLLFSELEVSEVPTGYAPFVAD